MSDDEQTNNEKPNKKRTESVTRPQLPTGHPNLYDCLLIGIDTIDVGIHPDWGENWPFLYETFEALKLQAADYREQHPPLFELANGVTLRVNAGGKQPMYRFSFQTSEFILWVGKGQKPNGKAPNLYASLNSESIWRNGAVEIIDLLTNTVTAMGAEVQHVQISRVDLCADFYVPDGFHEPYLIEQTVCHSGERRSIYNSNALSTYYVGGATGHTKMRLYNKSLEITVLPDRAFFIELWKVPEGSEVWRLEFQLGRPFLKDYSIESLDDLLTRLQTIWNHLTNYWLTIREGDDANKSRRPLSDFWQAVQNCEQLLNGSEFLRKRDKPSTEPQAYWYLVRMKNYFLTLAALWMHNPPGQTVRTIIKALRKELSGNVFDQLVMLKAIEKGWPTFREDTADA